MKNLILKFHLFYRNKGVFWYINNIHTIMRRRFISSLFLLLLNTIFFRFTIKQEVQELLNARLRLTVDDILLNDVYANEKMTFKSISKRYQHELTFRACKSVVVCG